MARLNSSLVNTIFGVAKIRGILGVFQGVDTENEVRFLVSNLAFSQSSSHSKSHHVVEQNATGQTGRRCLLTQPKIRYTNVI